MAENRVTAEMMEVAIARASVPGNARLTAEMIEVALLKNIDPGGNARVTTEFLEVAILVSTGAAGARTGDFFFAVP